MTKENSALIQKLYQLEIVFFSLVALLLDYLYHLEALNVIYTLLAISSAYTLTNSKSFYRVLIWLSFLSVLGILRNILTHFDLECFINRSLILFSIISAGIFCKKYFRFQSHLNEEELRFKAALQIAPNGYFLLDKMGKILNCNDIFNKEFSFIPRWVESQNFKDIMGASQQFYDKIPSSQVKDYPEDIFKPEGIPLKFKMKNSADKIYEIRISHFKLDDKTFYVGSSQDISEQVAQNQQLQAQAVELEKAYKELDSFAFTVSHDLKAPLRGISLLSNWIMEDSADQIGESGSKNLIRLQDQVGQMNSLIDQVLKYSRVGREDSTEEKIDMNAAVEKISLMLEPPENVKINIQGILPPVMGIPIQMEQLLQNLIGNAINYGDKEETIINIGYWSHQCESGYYVEDNGPGIERKNFDKIFEIFKSAHPKKHTSSSGVGLSIAKKIVQHNGGKIWVESELGVSSKFYFSWPKKVKELESISK